MKEEIKIIMVSGVHLYFSGLIDSGRPPVSGSKSKLVCSPPKSKQLTFRHSCKQIQTGREIEKCHVLLKKRTWYQTQKIDSLT